MHRLRRSMPPVWNYVKIISPCRFLLLLWDIADSQKVIKILQRNIKIMQRNIKIIQRNIKISHGIIVGYGVKYTYTAKAGEGKYRCMGKHNQ